MAGVQNTLERKSTALDEEFSNFMVKVHEVGMLMKGLNSKDKEEANAAIEKVDRYLDPSHSIEHIDEATLSVKKNRTIINQKAFDNMGKSQQQESMSPEAFMKSVEEDAKQRAEDRRLRTQVANSHKKRAIEAFNNKQYEKALNFYNKAIEEVRDSGVLYTSRALTCLKLDLYERVIADCDLVLRAINENSLKAWLFKAKAHKAIGQDEEANRCVNEAITKHSDSVQTIQDYMNS